MDKIEISNIGYFPDACIGDWCLNNGHGPLISMDDGCANCIRCGEIIITDTQKMSSRLEFTNNGTYLINYIA